MLILGLTWAVWQPPVHANGMAFIDRSAATGTGEVGTAIPTAQRAALVRDGTSWSLLLEPRYERPDVGAGWLVPFAHCPTVSAADPALLAELGLVTAPLFLELCVQECRCGDDDGGGCLPPFGGGKAGDAGDNGASAAQGDGDALDVDVWQTGTIGNLDFVVISAQDPADIPAWLDQRDYDNPPELAAFVTDHAAEYGCYFAARVAAPVGGSDAFPAVRFDLDPRDPPTYPLKLTGLGVAEGRTLDLTLFVVNPADRYDDGAATITAPANFAAQATACTGTTAQEFQACLDAELAADPTTLAVTFHDALDARNAVMLDRAICDFQHRFDDFWNPGWCLSADTVFPGIPETWTPEVEGWLKSRAHITRFEGRLPPAMLAADLIFHAAPGARPATCDSDADCWTNARWSWDGTVCAPAGIGATCMHECYGAAQCPDGWACETVVRPQGYYQDLCVPPPALNHEMGAAFQDPLPRVDGLHITYEDDCDLDCDDICDGTLPDGAVAFGPPRSARQVLARVPALVILLAAQGLLFALRRRRD
jgi:hypothetical protein